MNQLNVCANDVLAKLDDCKPDDLACECCALQSMDQKCFGLCRHTSSAKFLDQLIADCASLSEVNSCGLPFKKTDQAEAKVSRNSFKAESKKNSMEIQERILSKIGGSSIKQNINQKSKTDNKAQLPAAIVLSSRIKNNATEEKEGERDVKNETVNATSFQQSNAPSLKKTPANTIALVAAFFIVWLI